MLGLRQLNMKEVNPKETTRAYAFEMWMNAPMPMVTFFKTLNVSRLVRLSRNKGLKFNMLMGYCVGKAASKIKEFYMLPVGDKLMQYDSIAVNTIVANSQGEVSSCDVPFSSDLRKFSEDTDGDGKDDLFYDCATCGSEKDVDYGFPQKVRAGLSLNNEFKFGAVTAIVDWGLYFYNPSRNIYADYHNLYKDGPAPKRSMSYKSPYGAGAEEAPHYIRFGLKYRVWDNLYLQASAKTHLHICEFVEFGLGYQIPFLKKGNRSEGKSNIFHHRKNWWKE